jgi:beta-glucanase (GH16 family)
VTVVVPGPVVEVEVNEFGEKLIFKDDFDTFDFDKWKHDLTMSGGGNWEFQLYHNNRTNSYVKDGILVIQPTLTADRIGDANLRSNYRMDMWGGSPADQCTGNNFYGCERSAGAGGNIINPIQSAKLTTATTFSFRYGRVEFRAKLPKGDWLWPGKIS